MKKFLSLLFLPAIILLPNSANAGLSEMCSPSVECNAGQDYYAGSCKPHIETIVNCPAAPVGQFSAFSCNYGCHFRTTPPSTECAGGVMVAGKCMTTTYLVDDQNIDKIWDGSTLTPLSGGEGGDGLWQTDNKTDIYRTDGKVGIGTKAPNYTLDIAGDLNLNKNKFGAALYASSRQMLWFNPDPALNYALWGGDAKSNLFPRNVGIGALPDEDFMLDVKGAVNINKDLTGAALYASNRQMLWFNPDPALNFVAWGTDAGSNLFAKPVGIGTSNSGTSSKLSVLNETPLNQFSNLAGAEITTKNDQDGATYGLTTNVTSNGTGATYGSYNIAFKTETGTAYGSNSFAQHSGANNTSKVYGVYGSSYNSSTNCVGQNCAQAIGVYGSSGSTLYGTGGYFEGGYAGVHAVGRSSNLESVGLLVQNNDLNSPGAIFECSGNCTSAIFKDGNNASSGVANSGFVIIGEPGAAHLAFDNNSFMAKASGLATAPLYINENGGGVAFGTTFPNYKITLDNVASNLGGRGIANAWSTYSDSRVKMNQKPLNYGLNDLMKLQAKSYDHYSGKVENGRVELGEDFDSTIGLIAQEVYKVIPEAVDQPKDEKNNLWALDYDKLVPVLIQSVQELKKEKDAEILELKKMNELLKEIVCIDHPQEALCK